MKILHHIDLGKAFELLKKELIECEIVIDKKPEGVPGINYAEAYGRLAGASRSIICGYTDTTQYDLEEEIKAAKEESNVK
jgi:hypothetical protein